MNNTPHPREIHGIKGLSERRRLPRLGKIRLGIKKTNSGGAEYPTEVDYFVCPPEVQAVYGPQPKSLRIMIPLEDINQVFPQAYKWYGLGSGLKCKGDGQVALRRWTDVEPGLQAKIDNGHPKGSDAHDPNDLVEIPCPCPRLKSGECAPKGHFMVLLPEVSLSGIYQIDTGSANNLVEINSAIDFLRSLLGRIAMIPLTLRREPVEITYQGKRRVHYLLKLTWEGNLHAAQQIRNATDTITLPALALPIPSDEGNGLSNESITEVAPTPPPLPTISAPAPTSPPPPLAATPVPAPPVIPQSTAAAEPPTSPAPSTPETSTPATPPNTPPAAQAEPTSTAPVAKAPKPAAAEEPKPPKPSSPPSQCNGCGATVTANVADYSQRYFKETICLNCQKQRFGKVTAGKK